MSTLHLMLRRVQVVIDAVVGIAFIFIGRLLPPMRPDRRDLTGKTAIITGANSGIGYGIAQQLAEMGASVILACRNEQKAEHARRSIVRAYPSAKVTIKSLDNASLRSVRAFAKEWNGTIDFFFHNAGISSCPAGQNFSEDGFEYIYQTNFLSSMLLTHLLERHLSPSARVIFTSSIASYGGSLGDNFSMQKTQKLVERGFHSSWLPLTGDNSVRYSQTKLMQAAFARALQSHFDLAGDGQRFAFSFEPGLVKTSVFGGGLPPLRGDPLGWVLAIIMPALGLEVAQGAATGVHLATSERVEVLQNGGRYFDRLLPRANKSIAKSSIVYGLDGAPIQKSLGLKHHPSRNS